jgi:hypothetical protein
MVYVIVHIQWNFSKPDRQETGSPWISADILSPYWTILCKWSLITGHPSKPAIFLVPVLAGFGKFHCN